MSAAQRQKPPGDLLNAVRTASPDAIEDAAARLPAYLRQGRWLGNNNRYLVDVVRKLKGEAKPGGDQVANPKHLAEYIAASAALHCADGWGYLGRALAAQTRGDAAVTRHLAYYASLRAGLSLLATRGVGIFSGANAAIDAQGAIVRFPGATHQAVWWAIEAWSDLPSGAELVSELIEPEGVPLSEWVDGLTYGSGTWNPLGRAWLRAWGLDLRMFANDRDTRNEASYRPTTLRARAVPDSSADASFVRQFWPLFEPSAREPFLNLDRHMLRLTLEQAFVATTNRNPRGTSFRSAISRSLSQNSDHEAASPLGRFLLRVDDPLTPELFVSADTRRSYLDSRYHVHALSRATLLMRIATGASQRLLTNAQVAVDDFRFWSEDIAVGHGLCDVGAFPEQPQDLWADVSESLDAFAEEVMAGAAGSVFQLGDRTSAAMHVLSGCERMGIWGLAA